MPINTPLQLLDRHNEYKFYVTCELAHRDRFIMIKNFSVSYAADLAISTWLNTRKNRLGGSKGEKLVLEVDNFTLVESYQKRRIKSNTDEAKDMNALFKKWIKLQQDYRVFVLIYNETCFCDILEMT